MDDPIARLREAGYTVEEATPASDEVPTIYVAEKGDQVVPDDPATLRDFSRIYVTEDSAGDFVT
jgi:hypothetical protein